jgi:phytoene dehydrogenase-like protein
MSSAAPASAKTFTGFKVSNAAYANGLFHTAIVRDLKLAACGYEVLPRDPLSFTPFPDGRSLKKAASAGSPAQERIAVRQPV